MAKKLGRGMVLDDLLHRLVQASSDFEGAVLVSDDGLVIAAAWPSEEVSRPQQWDDSDVGAVATRAFEQSGQASDMLERGVLQGMILVGDKGNTIITRAGPEALCVVLLKPEAKLGIASFEAARISRQVAEVLS